jgi:hypothetical protein
MQKQKGYSLTRNMTVENIYRDVIDISPDTAIQFEAYYRWLKYYYRTFKRGIISAFSDCAGEVADKATKALELVSNAHSIHIMWVSATLLSSYLIL